MQISLPAYYDRLRYHDWSFHMSDDPGVYRAGQAAQDELIALARTSQAHGDLFTAFYEHHVDGGPLPVKSEAA